MQGAALTASPGNRDIPRRHRFDISSRDDGSSTTGIPGRSDVYKRQDWRMGLSILIAPALAMIPMFFLMKNYNSQYAAYMEANNHVNNIIIELSLIHI